jgi:hypothetical protein
MHCSTTCSHSEPAHCRPLHCCKRIATDALTLQLLRELVCPGLHHLHLEGLSGVSDEWLPIIAGCRRLHSLNLSGAAVRARGWWLTRERGGWPGPGTRSAATVAPLSCQHTHTLAAHTHAHTQLSDASATWLAWLWELRVLRLQHCTALTDAGLAPVSVRGRQLALRL